MRRRQNKTIIGRFAPSPSGRMYLGNFMLPSCRGYMLALRAENGLFVSKTLMLCDVRDILPTKKLVNNILAFRHLPLLTAPDGCRLSKRDDDSNISALCATHTPNQVLGIIMNAAGKCPKGEELSLDECLKVINLEC